MVYSRKERVSSLGIKNKHLSTFVRRSRFSFLIDAECDVEPRVVEILLKISRAIYSNAALPTQRKLLNIEVILAKIPISVNSP
jgi:hypothetical protein